MSEQRDYEFLISQHFARHTLTEAEGALLCEWVKQDSTNAEQFALAGLLHSRIYDVLRAQRLLEDENLSHDPFSDAAVMPAIRLPEEEDESMRPIPILFSAAEAEPVAPATAPVTQPAPQRIVFKNVMLWRIAASVVVLAGLGALIWRLTSKSPLATVASTYDAKWDTGLSFETGAAIPTSPLYLKSGLAEIQFDRGASIVVEGPAFVRVLSDNSVELTEGKLSAKVPPSAHGFTVETSTARVVDLGTEFGVSVEKSGATEIDVFKGTVQAKPRGADPSAPPVPISAGQAASIALGVCHLVPSGVKPQEFVRSLAVSRESLDVLDLICGGDGTTHRRTARIDQRSGTIDLAQGTITPPSEDSDSKYCRTGGPPALDGTFIPDGSSVTDSAQDHFAFRSTGGGMFNSIYVGGPPIWMNDGSAAPYPIKLGDTDYSLAPHGYLYVHANGALTLNLAEIRRLHPGRQLTRFKAVVGNFRNTVHGSSTLTNDKADALVLVDGTPRFARMDFTRLDGAISVDVPIHDADYFLTLAITQGSDGMNSDWVIFGDPMLE